MPAFVFIVLLNDYKTYQCFKCDTDSDGFQQFYTNEKCEIHCKNKSNVCVCDGACVKCLPHSKAKGLDGCQQMLKDKANEKCRSVPYNGKPNEGSDTKGSDSKKTPKGGYIDTGSNGGSSNTKPPGGSGGKNGGSTDSGSTDTGTSVEVNPDYLVLLETALQDNQKPKPILDPNVYVLSANM